MPIKVVCACKAAFAAKDELAGKTVKCPKCQQPLKIPAAGAAPAAAAAAPRPPAKPAPIQRPKASSGASSLNLGDEVERASVSDVFSDVGLGKQVAGTRPCPGCAAPMAQNAVICIKCGYNAKLGRRMETVKSGGGAAGGHDGHGAGAQDLLNRAAQVIAEDQEEERKKTGEGLPWWAYLVGLTFVIGFIIMMMLLPKGVGLYVAGGVLIFAAIALNLYSVIRHLIIAFQENVAQGLLNLFVPFYYLFYVITRWDRVGTYFLMNLASNVMSWAGWGAIYLGAYMASGQGEDAMLPPQPAARTVASAPQTTTIPALRS